MSTCLRVSATALAGAVLLAICLRKYRALIVVRNALHADSDWWRSRYYAMKALHEKSTTPYWRAREASTMYQANGTIIKLARQLVPDAATVLDVGAHEGTFISQFSWIPTKGATDMRFDENQAQQRAVRNQRGVAFLPGDFLTLNFGPTPFDLVICNQVVEHLPDGVVEPFVRKLRQVARLLIVSTTLDLPRGVIHSHVQDPISKAKFRTWFERRSGPRGRIIRHVAEQATALMWDKSSVREGRRPYPTLRNVSISTDDGGSQLVRNQIVVWKRAGTHREPSPCSARGSTRPLGRPRRSPRASRGGPPSGTAPCGSPKWGWAHVPYKLD